MNALQVPGAGRTARGSVEGHAGVIECQLVEPAGATRGIAVVCHPHPLYGGAMSNKVVYTLDAAARGRGLASLRFNFRGVGASEGYYDQARGEVEDCVLLCEWMRAHYPGQALLLAGFSFGGFVALQAAGRVDPAVVVTVAPPLEGYIEGASRPRRPDCPWLTIHSRDDEVVSFAETRRAAADYVPEPQWHEVDGAGHFFHGRLSEVRDASEAFLERHWPAGDDRDSAA